MVVIPKFDENEINIFIKMTYAKFKKNEIKFMRHQFISI